MFRTRRSSSHPARAAGRSVRSGCASRTDSTSHAGHPDRSVLDGPRHAAAGNPLARAIALAGAALVALGGGADTVASAAPSAAGQSNEGPGPAAAVLELATGDRPVDRAIALLDHLDATRLTVDYVDQPLLRIVTELERVHGIPLTVDWTRLVTVGARERTEVTLQYRETPALSVLQGLALALGDGFDVARIEAYADRVHLTTDDAIGGMVVVDAYDVRDLLSDADVRRRVGIDDGGDAAEDGDAPADGEAEDDAAGETAEERTFPPARDPNIDPFQPAPPAGGGILGQTPPPPPPPIEDFERGPAEALLGAALEHVDPTAWMRYGGSDSRISERDGVLLVTAPATTHRMLRGVLDTLRRASPRGVELETVLATVPVAVWERLDRRFDPSQAIFARRLLADAGVVMRWTARPSVALGRTVEVGSTDASGSFELTVTPTLDAESGVLTLAVSASITGDAAGAPSNGGDGAARSMLKTEAAIPFRAGAASMAFPGPARDTMQVLILLPSRY